ncbi:cell division protein FtsX [Aquabacter spiritensis]|uniref:Cell division transport system permease protein n=1 Tax=Aquabacter spiritensis TaxID=933073 RepID=A0A4R3LYU7_9HYPH|nr:ABC transporter permease [Aquabacter spiritensis]TCT05904.1 cell division transport system permease protein [Aquabacter spiritensis]
MSMIDPARLDADPPARPRRAGPRGLTPIVPRATVAGRALVAVVAIMTFLAGLTIGSVMAVRATAQAWRSDVAREVTIQIRAGDPAAVAAQVKLASELAAQTPGISAANVLTEDETARLLEPWLGTGLDLSSLPVPRIIVLRLDPAAAPDLTRLRRTLTDRIPTATLDDHRGWSRRLGAVAEGVVVTGLGLLLLVATATILSVVFATRAAVATNRTVVEVLHFVGARDGFIAAQFQRHFLRVGAEGGAIGGAAAAALFLAVALLPRFGVGGDPEAPSVFTWLHPGPWGFAGIAAAVVLMACVTALTSRLTVYRTLRAIT